MSDGNVLTIRLENIVTKCDEYSIDYGSFDVKIFPKFRNKLLSSLTNIRVDINWLHPGTYERDGQFYFGGICWGEELFDQLQDLVISDIFYKNRKQFDEILSHILHGYFSTCQVNHIVNAKVPEGITCLTNDDFFRCIVSAGYVYHVSNESQVKNVVQTIYNQNFFDKRIIDYNIYDCKACQWCGAVNSPTNECFMCKRQLIGMTYRDTYDTELLN